MRFLKWQCACVCTKSMLRMAVVRCVLFVVQVTPEGKYVPPPKDNQKATYSTMLFVRSDIVAHAARYLAKATCIATRYCCVRRQTAPTPGARELQARRSLHPRCCQPCGYTHTYS